MSNTPAAEGNQPSPPQPVFTQVPSWDEQFMRPVDPIRAAALHAAVQVRHQPIDEVLQVAERFERWLAGTDEDSP